MGGGSVGEGRGTKICECADCSRRRNTNQLSTLIKTNVSILRILRVIIQGRTF